MAREHPEVVVNSNDRTSTSFGDKGPDKYTFLFEGLLDRTYDGRNHEFVINGRKMDVCIRGGRQIPSWQCPNIPGIAEGRVEYEWADAWEFSGYAYDERGVHGVQGIYSPKSRRGVYHLWLMQVPKGDGCPDARQDLHAFFANRDNDQALLALERAMRHMVRGTAVGGHHIDCEECWELFRALRQTCELP